MSDERDFKQQLEAMSADAARQSRLRSAAGIRKRAVRRRTLQVAATGLATVVVLVVAWTVAAPGTNHQGVGPTSPATNTTDLSTPDPSGPTKAGGNSPTAPSINPAGSSQTPAYPPPVAG